MEQDSNTPDLNFIPDDVFIPCILDFSRSCPLVCLARDYAWIIAAGSAIQEGSSYSDYLRSILGADNLKGKMFSSLSRRLAEEHDLHEECQQHILGKI
ncbi:MAG: hypothetical protein Q7S88_01525 [Candidatus Daviesbacteria bacterium]|nr:hypothetical protein [Candidatus Daviesbacteria bacterium]